MPSLVVIAIDSIEITEGAEWIPKPGGPTLADLAEDLPELMKRHETASAKRSWGSSYPSAGLVRGGSRTPRMSADTHPAPISS